LKDFREGVIPPDPFEAFEQPNQPKKKSKKKGDASSPAEPEPEKSTEEPPFLYRLRTPFVLSSMTAIEAFLLRFEAPRRVRKRRRVSALVRGTLSAFGDGAAGIVLFYVLLWNLNTLKREPFSSWMSGRGDSFLPEARPLINLLRLDQHWGLFAP
jgi:hypothetical protein